MYLGQSHLVLTIASNHSLRIQSLQSIAPGAEETFFHLTIGIRDMNMFCSDFAQAQFLDMVLKWRMRMLKEVNFMLTPT